MKDPRKAGRTRSSTLPPPAIEKLRAAAAGRVGRLQHADHASGHLLAHLEALGAARTTVSPAKPRGGVRKTSPPGSFGLPD